MHSDIHVLVRFHEQSVFAGEQLRCTITFKNVAHLSSPTTPSFPNRRRSRRESISQIAAQVARNNTVARQAKSRRSASNDSSADQPARPRTTVPVNNSSTRDDQTDPQRPGQKQQRSVSIISVTSPTTGPDLADATNTSWVRQQRPGHQRSSTVQMQHGTQRRVSQRSRQDSPTGLRIPHKGSRASSTSPAPSGSRESTPDFKASVGRAANPASTPEPNEHDFPSFGGQQQNPPVAPAEDEPIASERSSADFYSLSNHSQETLMSEQPSIMSDHPPMFSYSSPLPRRPTLRPPQRPQAVSLLMGYAQLNATFTLDASLIDQAHFEEVKRKGFLGGQAGGGVVGVKKARPNSGFLGNFNFNSIGGSLNSLMGGENMSSVKEMNAVTNARAIPLLSTPQSLLFVDMHLEPGEEQSYSYFYPLPPGLPSSHRGKAIKISYNLTVGVQGLPGTRDLHTVRQVNVPVRVFPGVNYDGEVYGHDLMQPHVILQDLARTKSISSPETQEEPETPATKPDEKSTTDFLHFVDTLLDQSRRRHSSSGTMDAPLSSQDAGNRGKTQQAIDRAILFSNQLSDAEASPNRFEIARNGLRVAVIVVDRPLHRLGETVTAVVDFSDAQVPCASLKSSLETCEKVAPALAVRSAATINRITRRVFAARSETVLFTKRATFAPTVPASATPTFVTSGINLDWSLRFEFGTVKPVENEQGEMEPVKEFLEEVVKDERGAINVAVENLECETFEVTIPITVYGDLVPDGKEGDEVVGIPI